MTYTVAAAPTDAGKQDVLYSPGESTASAINTVVPDGSVGVMVDDAAGIRFSTTAYNKLRQMRDIISETYRQNGLDTQADGASASINGTLQTLKPNFTTVPIADNTSSALTAAMGSGSICMVLSGATRGSELCHSAAIRAIDTLLEKYWN